jgi:dTDP-glucose 4,6-dehydratase
MYIKDFIPTLARVCERFVPGEVYNIGGVEYRSVEDLSNLILEYTGAREELVTYMSEDKHNIVNKRPDISKAKLQFGHNPIVTIDEGVLRTIVWMKKIYNIK